MKASVKPKISKILSAEKKISVGIFGYTYAPLGRMFQTLHENSTRVSNTASVGAQKILRYNFDKGYPKMSHVK